MPFIGGGQSANTWRLHGDVAICGFNDVDRHIWLSIQSDSTGIFVEFDNPERQAWLFGRVK
jgi:hypothetical protein